MFRNAQMTAVLHPGWPARLAAAPGFAPNSSLGRGLGRRLALLRGASGLPATGPPSAPQAANTAAVSIYD